MSSIFGFLKDPAFLFDQKLTLSPMLLWNRAYGNSNEECYETDNISLGCCIESLSETPGQKNAVLTDGVLIAVIDAVIYNREELINRYFGSIAESSRSIADDKSPEFLSDAELLLSLIARSGPDLLKEINGDFSGAVYNRSDRSLLLFRDHMGIRPLFYYTDDRLIAFSTDLRGLTALHQIDASISETWIYKTVNGLSADTIDNTAYENIHCVTPASYFTFSFIDRSVKIHKKTYWKLHRNKVKLPSEKAYQEKLRDLITDSVSKRLAVVSGPVGAELSGGLDSGIIDILINRAGRKGIYFSWSLDPDELKLANNDERLIISDICLQENITCNYAHFSSDFTPKLAEKMSRLGITIPSEGSNDFRMAFPTSANTYTLYYGAQFVAEQGSKVMFTGHGGDEGVSHRSDAYEMYYNREFYHYLRYIWSTTHGQKHRILKTVKRSVKKIITDKQNKRESYIDWYASPELINPEFASKKKIKNNYRLQFAYDPVAYIESGGIRNRLDNIALVGAYSGVRYMIPYLDYRVIDYAVSIPRYLYIKGKTNRYIFREAFRDIMPESLYNLKTKEDTSIRNIEPNPDWYESFAERKAEIISHLDRDYWKQYLNFDEIDKLSKAGKPSDEEYEKETKQLKVLLLCALAKNLVEKSRSCISGSTTDSI